MNCDISFIWWSDDGFPAQKHAETLSYHAFAGISIYWQGFILSIYFPGPSYVLPFLFKASTGKWNKIMGKNTGTACFNRKRSNDTETKQYKTQWPLQKTLVKQGIGMEQRIRKQEEMDKTWQNKETWVERSDVCVFCLYLSSLFLWVLFEFPFRCCFSCLSGIGSFMLFFMSFWPPG